MMDALEKCKPVLASEGYEMLCKFLCQARSPLLLEGMPVNVIRP
jgi:hypothetical protein